MASGAEDTRVWVGRVVPGRNADHARFVDWLNGPEAQDIFVRRRLTEYTLTENNGELTIVFKAPRTDDPRLMIDFLRYPGVWPDFWEFQHGGPVTDMPPPSDPSRVRVHWRRSAP